MKLPIFAGLALVACAGAAQATQVWSGLDFTFEKANFADWTLPENQDRITDNVWITRADNQGIFNIAQEPGYDGFDDQGPSPVDTEWAFGTTDDYQNLSYTTWAQAHGGFPPGLVGQDMVVHLISDDIYIDIQFTGWQGGGQGGGFSYMRGVPAPGSLALLGISGLALRRRRA
jgi:hypothetical protein